jgi:hypothetical protein
VLVRGFVVAGGAAGLAVEEAVGAETDVDYRLAEAAELFALARTFRLFALRAFVFGGTGTGAHENNVAREGDGWNMTEVMSRKAIADCRLRLNTWKTSGSPSLSLPF